MFKSKAKLFIALILVLSIFSGACIGSFAAGGTVTVKLDGSILPLNGAPVVSGNEVLVPAINVFEALGGTVSITKTGITVSTADKTIAITDKSANATVNGSAVTLAAAAKTANGVLLVPASFITKALGAEVKYNATTKILTINYFSKLTGTLKIGGSTTIQPIAQSASDDLMNLNKGLSITVVGGGSGAGIKGAMDGTFNIGNSSAELSASDKTTYPNIKEFQIGSDGIAIITNPSNPVKNLSKQQVKDIFAGKITNWKDVGGNNAAIFIQTRESTSGTLSAFKELAMADKNAKLAATATPHASNGLMLQAVSSNKNAIGFLSMGYLTNKVTAVKIDGVSAVKVNAMTKKWPYVRPLIVVTNGNPSELAAKYINYLKSPEGQKMISAEGYLPINAKNTDD